MKLKFYINSNKEKIYTLDEEILGQKTQDAHYKFRKIKDAPPSNNLKVQKSIKTYSKEQQFL